MKVIFQFMKVIFKNNNNALSNELRRKKERENNNQFRGHCVSLLQSTACTATLGPISFLPETTASQIGKISYYLFSGLNDNFTKKGYLNFVWLS